MTTVTTFAYAELDGFRPLRLDLRMPDGVRRPPVVFWIHGGGWRSGDRIGLPETLPRLFDMAAEAGFAVVSIDYRLSGEARFPAQLDDVQTAAAWLLSNGEGLGLDTDRIAIWGESAGGHLASLLTLVGEPAMKPRCAVLLYAPSDFLSFEEQKVREALAAMAPGATFEPADNSVSKLLGALPSQLPDLARAASPITYARADAPPILLLHGDADAVCPIEQSEQLAARLREVGATVEMERFVGADHIFLGMADPHEPIARAIEFTAQYFAAVGSR